jgi:hypothetical protein
VKESTEDRQAVGGVLGHDEAELLKILDGAVDRRARDVQAVDQFSLLGGGLGEGVEKGDSLKYRLQKLP